MKEKYTADTIIKCEKRGRKNDKSTKSFSFIVAFSSSKTNDETLNLIVASWLHGARYVELESTTYTQKTDWRSILGIMH